MKHVITSVLATYMLANAATAIEMYNVAGTLLKAKNQLRSSPLMQHSFTTCVRG